MPVDSLLPADAPRLSGEGDAHVRLLAESEAILPPIVVHRSTMRVIDGMHRLYAAVLRGQKNVEVRFFEGDESDALRMQTMGDRAEALQQLRQDPSLRFNEAGRALLRWLDSQPVGPPDLERAIENVPAHCAEIMVRLARGNAEAWRELAEQLERR
ncbi:hypothetical protein DMH04_36305 [Kibdelosporangium aridum]|uniref:ParB-like N-terminal domain-containing protein n=1 Tax=Kibdelosporangium aridum TaxID=2030 RepID=A0A428YZH9_KIBAR|nr:hypothetical protein DMH04_36305 [Kibdelosporangium aridum]